MTDGPGGLDRGQRVYDRWAARSRLYDLVDRLTRSIRHEAVAELDLATGDRAVDVGCGPGASLGLLEEAVGPDGRVVGVDYSAGMARRARARAARLPTAAAVRGDARHLPLAASSVDGALASLAVSTVPEARAAVAEVRRVLRDDGRFAVFDARVPDGAVGRLVGRAYRRTVNWQGHDVQAIIEDVFPTVEVVATYDAGLAVLLLASG
jgi:demethylmenaquinone methyltransferase/2-methoxy-6-polyprenyl-1,4-benzoquinol methylase